MVIVSYSRKTASFYQLLRYINDNALEHQQERYRTYNLLGENLHRITDEFYANYRLLRPHKGANSMYHEVLSFSHRTPREQLTEDVIWDLVDEYIRLRQVSDHLIFANIHHGENLHVHLMISSNAVGSNRRKRLSKREFLQAQELTQVYQQEHYPQLYHSLIGPVRERQSARSLAAIHQKRKRNEPLWIDELRRKVEPIFAYADSRDDFIHRLHSSGLETYKYRSRTNGIVAPHNGRKVRFSRLGIKASDWQALANSAEYRRRLAELERLQEQQRGQGQEFTRER